MSDEAALISLADLLSDGSQIHGEGERSWWIRPDGTVEQIAGPPAPAGKCGCWFCGDARRRMRADVR